MIKRHRNVELDKNKKQELYYRQRYQGQYLVTSEFKHGSWVLGILGVKEQCLGI